MIDSEDDMDYFANDNEDQDFFEHYSDSDDSETSSYSNPALKSPLIKACYENDVTYVMEAISQGKDLNIKDQFNCTTLHYAAISASIDVLKLLVKQPLIEINVQNHYGDTPLHCAIEKCDNPEVLSILIIAGADVNIMGRYNHTPLKKLFCRRPQWSLIYDPKVLEMGRILLENGANIYIKDNLNALTEAIRLYDENYYDDWLNFVCMFLYYGGDVIVHDNLEEGESAISKAMFWKYHELCGIMLPYITDFNMIILNSNMREETLFIKAIRDESSHLFYMIEHGANINFSNGIESCLYYSIYHSIELFEYIFTHCDETTILEQTDFIIKLVSSYKIKKNFIRCFNLILEHKLADEIFANSNIYHINLHVIVRLFDPKVSLDDQIKMLYSLLMYYNKLSASDLRDIYKSYNFDERFEAYLRVNVVIENLEMFVDEPMLNSLCFPDLYQVETETFPTLQALSRNCIRKNIRKDLIYGANNVYFKYYNYLLQLDVPPIIKDILTLKKLV